ncbi:MAG: hypothetical protein WC828_04995 [Thermoleophilia bacterium]|jgi:hypothetical protein
MISPRGENNHYILINGGEIASDAVYALGAVKLKGLDNYCKKMLDDAVCFFRDFVKCVKQGDEFRAHFQPGERWAVQACENAYSGLKSKDLLDDSNPARIIEKLQQIMEGAQLPRNEINELQDFFRDLSRNLDKQLDEQFI